MCRFKSGIITKKGVTLAPMYNDSHSRLLESMGIQDTQSNAMRVFVRAELVPPNNDKTADIEKWKYIVDQDVVPRWYEKDSGKYETEMREAVKEWLEKHFTVFCGRTCVKIKEDELGTYYMLADSLFDSEFGNDNNYATSNIRKKILLSDFAKNLKREYGDKLVPISINLLSLDGLDDYGSIDGDILALRSLDLQRECRKNIPNSSGWEWLSTPFSTPSGCSSDYVCCAYSDGYVSFSWYGSRGAVRPFFIIKS